MKQLISTLLKLGANLSKSKSGIGFMVYNVKPISDNLEQLTELAKDCSWNLKLYPATTSFDSVTGQQITKSARYLVAPQLVAESLSEAEALAEAQRMMQ
jgi:uncharacterized phage infection (PIP) family protein YhgE|tara:strand:+ start:4183 stop:4479 length:297 start_codon:yes stop_codon:yes gene_type:complete